jgi:hypothetical protein
MEDPSSCLKKTNEAGSSPPRHIKMNMARRDLPSSPFRTNHNVAGRKLLPAVSKETYLWGASVVDAGSPPLPVVVVSGVIRRWSVVGRRGVWCWSCPVVSW